MLYSERKLLGCKNCENVTLGSGNFPTPFQCKITKECDWLDYPKRFIKNCPFKLGDKGDYL